jgi:hypothetical protein
MFCASPSPSGHSKQICWPLIRVSELLSLCVSTKQARAHLMFLRSFSSEISKDHYQPAMFMMSAPRAILKLVPAYLCARVLFKAACAV